MRASVKKQFREDLFYRLNKFCVVIPPLRERGDDTKLLAEYFYEQSSQSLQGETHAISPDVLDYIGCSPWYGNVRELQSFIEMLACINMGDVTSVTQIRESGLFSTYKKQETALPEETEHKDDSSLRVNFTIESALPKEKLEQALLAAKYNKVKTAQMLGISRSSLYKLLREYNL